MDHYNLRKIIKVKNPIVAWMSLFYHPTKPLDLRYMTPLTHYIYRFPYFATVF